MLSQYRNLKNAFANGHARVDKRTANYRNSGRALSARSNLLIQSDSVFPLRLLYCETDRKILANRGSTGDNPSCRGVRVIYEKTAHCYNYKLTP